MESITIDGQGEEDFRRSIEAMLRRGQADAAAARLRALVEPYAGAALPARFRSITSADVRLESWTDLAHRIGEHDRPGHRISAIEITAGAGEPQGGQPGPVIMTRYFSDEDYSFSGASRRDLLQGYGAEGGSVWQGHAEGGDTALSLTGMDDLFDAVARLEARLMSDPAPGEQEIRAGSLGACYLAVLLHQAVEDAIDRGGLPRPLCVLAGTGDAYPYFDAPVVSAPECREAGLGASVPIALSPALAEACAIEDEESEQDQDDEAASDDEQSGRAQGYGSLLSLGASIRVKKPVITVDEAEAAAASHHYEVGAQHRLTLAGNADLVGVLPDLAPADEREAALAGMDGEWQAPQPHGAVADAQDWEAPSPPAREEPCDAPAPVEAPGDLDHPPREDVPEAATAGEERVPEEEAAPALPAASRTIIPPPASHSLRSRVALRQTEHVTGADRLLALLKRAAEWLQRFRR